MKRREPPPHHDASRTFEHLDTLITYLEYAVRDVEAASSTSASLLKLAIANLKDDDDPSEPPRHLLS